MAANKELVDRNQFKVKDLPVGEKMLFRVVAVNIAGRSPPASLTHPVTIREIVGQLALTTSCLVFSSLTKNQNFLFCPPNLPEHPKIRLPRHLRNNLVTFVGDKVNLVIPFQVSLKGSGSDSDKLQPRVLRMQSE